MIKNMVCPRCIESVKDLFEQMDLPMLEIKLGQVTISKNLSSEQKHKLRNELQKRGFDLLDKKHTRLINAIKSIIIQEIHYETDRSLVNFSTLLSEKLHYDYAYLSRLFSSVEGQTIERFVLAQKIEKVKELLTYDEYSIAQIADVMNYSSSAHLSTQFKKITGMTPSEFKNLQNVERKSLDEL